MPEKVPTLYEQCFKRTAQLLKDSYWETECLPTNNPFSLIPSFIIDDLTDHMIHISILKPPLKRSDLRPLLTSGRARKLILKDIAKFPFPFLNSTILKGQDLQNILLDLSSSCHSLIQLELEFDKNYRDVNRELNILLSKARNVQTIVSTFEFDLAVIFNSVHLQNLTLKFPRNDDTYHFRPTIVRHSEVLMQQYINFDSTIALVLKYCTELISINIDISKSLEYLHAEELSKGYLSQIYKLQKCVLDCTDEQTSTAVLRQRISLVSLTCPYIQDLTISVNSNEHIFDLSNFRSLKSLIIYSEKEPPLDYTLGLQLVLQIPEFGEGLKTLTIKNFTNIDFSSIGKCCPNIEDLHVGLYYQSGNDNYEILPTSFQKLRMLKLNEYNQAIHGNTVLGILSNAIHLEKVFIRGAGNLTDDMLNCILQRNCLSKVIEFIIPKCGLSVVGLRTIAGTFRSLKWLGVFGSDLNFKEVIDAISKINPNLRVV